MDEGGGSKTFRKFEGKGKGKIGMSGNTDRSVDKP